MAASAWGRPAHNSPLPRVQGRGETGKKHAPERSGVFRGEQYGPVWAGFFQLRSTRDMQTQEEIFEKVSSTLVEALNVDEEDVKPTSTLQGDLGAESIDFLDIVFRLEREFGIKIPRGELFPESIFQGDPEFVQNGKVTQRGLDELRTRMPFADLSSFERNPDFDNLSDLFTVELITRYIQGKLNSNN